jgi:CHASE3 domain sensor protein
MTREWTFGRRIGAGCGALVALTMLIGVLSIYALRSESQASSAETPQTVSQLAGLSRDLLRMVRAEG